MHVLVHLGNYGSTQTTVHETPLCLNAL